VLVVAAVLLTACGQVGMFSLTADTSASPSSPSSSAAPGAVPFVPLPPRGEKIPDIPKPESPAPARASVKVCRASQLRGKLRAGAGLGTEYDSYTIDLAAGRPCRLTGYPKLAATDAARPVALRFRRTHDLEFDPWHGPVLLTRKRPAFFRIAWSDNMWCSPTTTVTNLVITSGGGSTSLPGLGTLQGVCDPKRKPVPAAVELSPFTPATYRSARKISDWNDVHASKWPVPVDVTPGTTLDLPVTLTAKRDTPLDVCPDVELLVNGSPPQWSATYQLNCAGVTTVDGSGVPYLPAGVPVTFDAHFSIPAAGRIGTEDKISWSIQSPGLYLSVGSIVKFTAGSSSPSASSS